MTVRQIAQHAGVSPATVSRALNDHTSVGRQTLKKVLRSYQELGLTPRPYRRKHTPLRKGREASAGQQLLFLWPQSRSELNPDAQTLMEGATIEARRHGAAVAVDYLGGADLRPLFGPGQRPDGLLLFSKRVTAEQAMLLRDIPTVWIYSGEETPWGDRIQPDHFSVGVKSLHHFAQRGLKRVCVVTDHTDRCESYETQRLAGFQAAAAQRGIDCRVLRGDFDCKADDADRQAYAAQIADRFVALKPRPQGLFVANGLGGHVHSLLTRRGVVPMRDVLMIAGDRTRVPEFLDPAPITLDVHVRDAGATAVSMLLWRMANPEALPVQHLTRVDLVMPEGEETCLREGGGSTKEKS